MDQLEEEELSDEREDTGEGVKLGFEEFTGNGCLFQVLHRQQTR